MGSTSLNSLTTSDLKSVRLARRRSLGKKPHPTSSSSYSTYSVNSYPFSPHMKIDLLHKPLQNENETGLAPSGSSVIQFSAGSNKKRLSESNDIMPFKTNNGRFMASPWLHLGLINATTVGSQWLISPTVNPTSVVSSVRGFKYNEAPANSFIGSYLPNPLQAEFSPNNGVNTKNLLMNIANTDVYNMLILILFLISVGIAGYTFLMYAVKNSRRPCHYCCFPPIHTPTPPVMREDFGAQASDTFLTAETSSSVAKGHIPDSPPPYESPPDYNSLPPEILMDARGLEDLCQQQSSQREPPSSSSRKSSTSSQSAPPPSFIQLSPNCTPTSTPPSGSEETGPAQITSVTDESSRIPASPGENSDDMWKLQASLRGNSSRDHLERDQKEFLEQRVEDSDLQNTLDAVSDISNKTCFEKYVKLDHKMFIPFNNNSLCDFPISLSRRDKDVDDLDASEFVERLKLDSVDQLRLPQKSNRRLKFSTKSPSVEPIHSSLGTGSLAVPLIPLPVKTSNQFPDRYSLQNFIESRGYPIDHTTLNAFLYSNLNTVEQAESLLKSKTNSDTTEHFEQLLDDILESESTNTLNIIVGCSDDMDCLESNIDFSDDSILLDKRLVDMSCNRIGNRATTRLSYPEDGTDSVLQILSSNSTKNISNSPNTSSAFHSAKSKVPQTSSSSSVCSTEIGKTSSSCPSQLPQDSTPASLVICSSHDDEENNKGIDVVDRIEQPGCRSSEQPNVPAAQPPTSDQHSTTVPFDDLVDVVIK